MYPTFSDVLVCSLIKGLFDLDPGNKMPGGSAACDLPEWCLVAVISMNFVACAWT